MRLTYDVLSMFAILAFFILLFPIASPLFSELYPNENYMQIKSHGIKTRYLANYCTTYVRRTMKLIALIIASVCY